MRKLSIKRMKSIRPIKLPKVKYSILRVKVRPLKKAKATKMMKGMRPPKGIKTFLGSLIKK